MRACRDRRNGINTSKRNTILSNDFTVYTTIMTILVTSVFFYLRLINFTYNAGRLLQFGVDRRYIESSNENLALEIIMISAFIIVFMLLNFLIYALIVQKKDRLINIIFAIFLICITGGGISFFFTSYFTMDIKAIRKPDIIAFTIFIIIFLGAGLVKGIWDLIKNKDFTVTTTNFLESVRKFKIGDINAKKYSLFYILQ